MAIKRLSVSGVDTHNPSPVIEFESHKYYLGDLFDKHLHAGQDIEIFTSWDDKKTIKKGEWVGKLDSYATVKGKPALIFFPSDYFGAKRYYVRYAGKTTFDDAILRYNYAGVQFTQKFVNWYTIPLAASEKLPTVEDSDKAADDLENREKALDAQDKWWNNIFGNVKQYALWGGAALSGIKALTSEKPVEQLAFGGVAAYLGYLASKETLPKTH